MKLLKLICRYDRKKQGYSSRLLRPKLNPFCEIILKLRLICNSWNWNIEDEIESNVF